MLEMAKVWDERAEDAERPALLLQVLIHQETVELGPEDNLRLWIRIP
jgi:hypothetical protein